MHMGDNGTGDTLVSSRTYNKNKGWPKARLGTGNNLRLTNQESRLIAGIIENQPLMTLGIKNNQVPRLSHPAPHFFQMLIFSSQMPVLTITIWWQQRYTPRIKINQEPKLQRKIHGETVDSGLPAKKVKRQHAFILYRDALQDEYSYSELKTLLWNKW